MGLSLEAIFYGHMGGYHKNYGHNKIASRDSPIFLLLEKAPLCYLKERKE